MHAAVSGRGGGGALHGLAAREGGAEGPAAARAALGGPAAVRGINNWSVGSLGTISRRKSFNKLDKITRGAQTVRVDWLN